MAKRRESRLAIAQLMRAARWPENGTSKLGANQALQAKSLQWAALSEP
jgi:hypothetical protein